MLFQNETQNCASQVADVHLLGHGLVVCELLLFAISLLLIFEEILLGQLTNISKHPKRTAAYSGVLNYLLTGMVLESILKDLLLQTENTQHLPLAISPLLIFAGILQGNQPILRNTQNALQYFSRRMTTQLRIVFLEKNRTLFK
jgi:hypothetical protein